MRFTEPLFIEVFEYTEEEEKLLELDIPNQELGFEKCSRRAFFSIDSAFVFDEELEYTGFFSGGSSFVTPVKFSRFLSTLKIHTKNETKD